MEPFARNLISAAVVLALSSAVQAAPIGSVEVEPNSTFSQANQPTGDSVTGVVADVADPEPHFDFFRWNLPPGSNVVIVVGKTAPSVTTAGLGFYAFDPDTHLLGDDYNLSGNLGFVSLNNIGDTANLAVTVPAAGVLGLRVGSYHGSQEGYRITLPITEPQQVPIALPAIPALAIGLGALAGLRMRQRRKPNKAA